MKKWLQKLLATWFKGWVPEVKEEKKPKPEPLPLPVPGPVPGPSSADATERPGNGKEADEGEGIWRTAEIHTAPESVRAWPAKDTLKIEGGASASLFHYDFGNRALWPDVGGGTVANVWCFLKRDGKWHGGPCDALRPANDRIQKERECLCVPEGKKRLHVPERGEVAWVCATGICRNGQTMRPAQRTSLVKMVVWK